MISALQHKSKYKSEFNFELRKKTSQTKYKSKFNFNFFLKKIRFLCFHVVELVKTFSLMYQLLM